MAAFALGLIGEASAADPLAAALKDASPVVQGRAAESLGAIGARSRAAEIAAMMRPHVDGGVLRAIAPDDPTYPLAPPVEAVRLGLYALARLKAYDALASVVLDAGGRPVSEWWPVAYALGRSEDARAAGALVTLTRERRIVHAARSRRAGWDS